MSVRANWHLEDLDLPDVDPAAEIAQILTAPALDLSDGNAKLYSDLIAAQFQATVAREAGFAGVLYSECAMKWTVPTGDGTFRNPCRTCPHFCHDSTHADSILCSLGVELENLLDAFEAARVAEGLDGDMLRTVEMRLDAAHELAEAVL